MIRERWILRPGWAVALLALVLPALLLAGTRAQTWIAPEDDVAEAPRVRVGYMEKRSAVAYLGVHLSEETEHPDGGARVTSVVEGSPAAEAGLREGDVIVRFDGAVIRGPAKVTQEIHTREPGDRVVLTVRRDGAEQRIDVDLANRELRGHPSVIALEGLEKIYGLERLQVEMPRITEQLHELRGLSPEFEHFECEGDDCQDIFFQFVPGRVRLGVQLVETTPELRRHLGGDDEAGVLVSKVLAGTPAEHAGVVVGDLIVAVGGDPVADSRQLRRALAKRAGSTFDVDVVRDGSRRTMSVTLPEGDDAPIRGPRALAPAPPAPPGAGPVPAPPAAVGAIQADALRQVQRALEVRERALHGAHAAVERELVSRQLAIERAVQESSRTAVVERQRALEEAERTLRRQLERETRPRGAVLL